MDTNILYLEAKQVLCRYDGDVQCKLIEMNDLRNNKRISKEATFKSIMKTTRNFRCDFYCPNLRLIVEINGGEWSNGLHVRGKRYNDDLRKANIAQLNNFTYLQYTYTQLMNGDLIDDMKIFIENESLL